MGAVIEGAAKLIEETGKGVGSVGRVATDVIGEVTSGKSLQRVGGMVQGAGKNIERNVGGTLSNLAYAVSTGNYNNLGRTLAPLGFGGLINPEDYNTMFGETAIQRAEREATAKAAEEKRMADLAAEQERQNKIKTAIDETIMTGLRRPGRAQTSGTLLTSGSAGGTLLTSRG